MAEPPSYYGEPNKTSFTSVVSELTSLFYTYLMSLETKAQKPTKNLLVLITSMAGLSYIGQKTVEATKEVQVKKAEADIEVGLHDRLVQVEMNNFAKKKQAYIEPLKQKYRTYLSTNPFDPKKAGGLKKQILDKIENGPPYIWN